MKRRWMVLANLGLAVLAASTVLAVKAGPSIKSGLLKGEDLKGLAQVDQLPLLGFSWEGEVRLFADGLDGSVATPPKTGDVRFTIASRGPSSACEALRQAAAERASADRARLSFKAGDGTATAMRLQGITVVRVDCRVRPWTAALAAETVKVGSGGKKSGRPKKDPRQDQRDEGIGPR